MAGNARFCLGGQIMTLEETPVFLNAYPRPHRRCLRTCLLALVLCASAIRLPTHTWLAVSRHEVRGRVGIASPASTGRRWLHRRTYLRAKENADAQVDGKSTAGGHFSMSELLSQYGLPAVSFHFLVWVVSLSTAYFLISASGDLFSLTQGLPDDLKEKIGLSGDGQTGQMGSGALALAVVEVIGPARLALTVAAAPAFSKAVRQAKWFCEFEDFVIRTVRGMAPS
eukprot:TRINITY_DN31494_c0_g1_i1.p1 TRINITY_DN31494_c0_g1~~TRINITY_DN31494_c0_g1_i1.p1  ORF type:complete len:226 (-),score=26.06 TRINITY_DN31494_c0_g1_i1:51-728(-)